MPVFQLAEAECKMDVDVAPTLSDYGAMKKAANDTYKQLSPYMIDDPAEKFSGLLNTCRTLILCEEKKESTLTKISETTKKAEEVLRESAKFCKRFRPFFETKAFLFTPSLDTIKTHPEFQKLTISLNAAANGCSNTPKKDGPSSDGLEVVKVLSRTKTNLPPSGVVKRKELQPGMEVWVMKASSIDIFVEGTILSSCEAENKTWYKVRFDETKTIASKLFTAKQLAYKTNPDVIVPVGTRIAARYTDGQHSRIYAGIVAEPPKFTNLERYLIFFDDGYAQYIEHKDVYIVCYQSIDVADDVHENISEFIRAYLQKYPERPMVKLQKDQVTKTEYDRKWWDTKVLDVDASMVKMYFIASQRTEWIYRGSTRLKLLYNELASAEASRMTGKHRRHNIVQRKPHQPYVEYTRDTRGPDDPDIETIELDSGSDAEEGKVKLHRHARRKTGGSQYLTNGEKPRNTARKSTSMRARDPDRSREISQPEPDIQSHLGFKDLHNLVSFSRVKYVPHRCCRSCRELTDPVEFKGKNPFLIPVYVGWERQIRKYVKAGSKLIIFYRTPCGKHLRKLEEIQAYLIRVQSRLTIDFFSVDPFVVVFRTFRPKEVKYELSDVTKGNENVPVCVVNSWENAPPPFVEYASKRFPGNGVFLNEDKEFLSGCSCKDNCQNSARCECQQITNYAYSGHYDSDVGYKFRRLNEAVITGIFECNSRCKCGPQCGNRVVQNGLQVRLQMFKTQRKGWGIRCLDDIDAGMFICIYAGQLLTEQGADEDGNQFGDEYLAELDHIEVAEKVKEGYESDADDIEDMEVEEIKRNPEEIGDEDYKDKSDDPSSSSDSDVNICDTDSEYETSLRSTAVSYPTRSRRKSIKISDCSSMSSMDSLSNNPSSKKNSNNKELPDLSPIVTLNLKPRPLSPASEEFLAKTELKRIPKISDDDSNPKPVAKKSLSMKHPGAAPPALPTIKHRGYKSVRSYYGEDGLYIMDAKSKGNIGRYLNHSCAPNVFVQNVFVETHDLRFPEVAFFAQNFIQAGTELTWDYNYEVGSVKDKIMYCYCDARTCRGRLL